MEKFRLYTKSFLVLVRQPNTTDKFYTNSVRTYSAASQPVVTNPLSTLSTNFTPNSNYASQGEPFTERIYRYLDITGFLTRWNSRKAWILDLEPSSRLAVTQITEHERKLSIFMVSNSLILFFLSIYYWYHAQLHISLKPPSPKQPDYPQLDMRRNDFVWHSKIPLIFPRDRCKECRWLESECKRICFDKLKAEGHKFWINGGDGPLSKPHYELHPPHHHDHHH